MEPLNLFRSRDFGALLQDTFQFVIQEGRSFWKGLLLYVAPFYLISSLLAGLVAVEIVSMFMTLDYSFAKGPEMFTVAKEVILPGILMILFSSWKAPLAPDPGIAGGSDFLQLCVSLSF